LEAEENSQFLPQKSFFKAPYPIQQLNSSKMKVHLAKILISLNNLLILK